MFYTACQQLCKNNRFCLTRLQVSDTFLKNGICYRQVFHVERGLMARAIAVCNQKGGVGKTTTAVNLSAYLALLGKRTLLIDLDSQGNATISSGCARRRLSRTVYDALVDGAALEELIIPSSVSGMDVVPSSLDLAGADLRIADLPDRETILRRRCEPIASRYDAIVMDCPPSLGLVSVNALVAADDVLIPVQCEYFALEGLNALMQAIDLVKRGPNPRLEICGIVLTMADFRAKLAKEVAEEVRGFYGGLVCESSIPRSVRLAESPSFGKPISAYDPHSPGAAAYQALANEVAARIFPSTNEQQNGSLSRESAQPGQTVLVEPQG